MLKALLKKQFLELNVQYFFDRKKGRRRSAAGIFGMIVLFLIVFFSLGCVFFGMAAMVGDALLPLSADWLYFALFGILALLFGTFGSVFSTYAILYKAKDNELLLSMPIPPSTILFSRMVGNYLMGLLFSAIVWLPVSVNYWFMVPLTPVRVIYPLLLLLFIALNVSVLTCLLGFVVALISGHVRHKSAVTVVLSLLFFFAYYYVCGSLNSLLVKMIAHLDQIGNAISGYVYPVYQLGKAAAGDTGALFIFIALVVAAFAVCYVILSRTFLRIATTNRGEKTPVYKEKTAKANSLSGALLKREFKRFVSSPIYMLNAGLGLPILLIVTVVLLFKMNTLRPMLAQVTTELPFLADLFPVFLLAGICLVIGMNAITAPSVSLEGKTLWQLRSLPVPAWEVLHAKEKMHLILCMPVASLCTAALGFVLEMSFENILFCIAAEWFFIYAMADIGLLLDLRHPNLDWTNEAVPVKQNLSVLFFILIGMVLSLAIAGIGYLAVPHIGTENYLPTCMAVLAILCILLRRRLRAVGVREWEEL